MLCYTKRQGRWIETWKDAPGSFPPASRARPRVQHIKNLVLHAAGHLAQPAACVISRAHGMAATPAKHGPVTPSQPANHRRMRHRGLVQGLTGTRRRRSACASSFLPMLPDALGDPRTAPSLLHVALARPRPFK